MGPILGLICLLVIMFKPHLAKVLAPVYAVVEGVLLGAVTVTIESQPRAWTALPDRPRSGPWVSSA